MSVSPIPTTRIHKDHPKAQIIGEVEAFAGRASPVQATECLDTGGLTSWKEGHWIEAIRLFLAYASYMDFTVYQMDVKSAFLYGTIEEEVYVSQPLGFVDPEFPNKVYKVDKALYGLHQAPRAWYETLSTYLLENGFRRGTIDKTLFIKKIKNDILLVQVYVDDIIFGSTKKSLSTRVDEFEQIMHNKFQMSSMGELTFFLGLQVKQKEDRIFISQDKYVGEIVKKFGFSSIRTTSTPMETNKSLTKDKDGEDVDVHLYRSMIGSLMYLTSSRPDIMFSVCACLRFQVQPKVSHLNAVKRIFRYLKGASLDGKSTTGGCQFLGSRLIYWQCKKQTVVANSTTEAEYIAASHCCGQVLWIQNQMLDYGYNFMQTKIHVNNESVICVIKNLVYHSKTKHIEISHHFIRDYYKKKLIEMVKIHIDYNVTDLLTKAFDVTRFQFLIASIGQTTTGKESSNSLMANSLPKTILPTKLMGCLETATVETVNDGEQQITVIVDGQTIAITEASVRRHLQLADADGSSCLPNTEIFEQLTLMGYVSNDDKLTFQKGGDTPGSDEGNKKLNELTELCTKLFDKVTSLEKDLKQTKKVYAKALTKLVKKRILSKQGRMSKTKYEEVEYELDQTDILQHITPTKVPQGEEQSQESSEVHLDVLSATKILTDISRARVKTYKSYTRRSTDSSRDSTAGGLFSTAKKILSTDERIAQKLNEEEMVKAEAREKQERIDFEKAIELQKQLDETDNIDWKIVAEQVQERQSDTIKRYRTLKKKPVIVAQARKNMIIYLKNMTGYKMGYFKGMSYDEIRPIFEKEYTKVQTLFKKYTGVEKTKTKRIAEETLLQESFKKLRTTEASSSEPIQEQPTKAPKELSKEELKKMLDIVPVEETKAEALQVKVRNITEAYQGFEDMLKGFDREDFVTLWSLVKERFRSAEPTEDMEKALWVELKRLFEPDKDDVLWKLQRYMHDPLTWRLYGSCGVHHVSSTRGHDIYMLTEKDYPLSTVVMGLMLGRRLQVEEDSEMARDLVMKIFIEANKPRR
ncbi:putative ribonuclease H-like domain-containing protein [Tanacetum coccineum]